MQKMLNNKLFKFFWHFQMSKELLESKKHFQQILDTWWEKIGLQSPQSFILKNITKFLRNVVHV